jgi:hypothetical protein
LFEAVRLAERFDMAIMSTKGMSVIASRLLLDRLAPLVEHVFVLHDFDIAGFSIRGTLATDSDRYTFDHDLADKVVDIGLRLADVEAMGLTSEPVKIEKDHDMIRDTLAKHGASAAEIEFLVPYDGECRRVELNAMTSRQLVDYVEAAFNRYGVAKAVPDNAVIREHARHLIESRLSAELLAQHADDIAEQAAAVELPDDLWDQILDLLTDQGTETLAWDEALARLL